MGRYKDWGDCKECYRKVTPSDVRRGDVLCFDCKWGNAICEVCKLKCHMDDVDKENTKGRLICSQCYTDILNYFSDEARGRKIHINNLYIFGTALGYGYHGDLTSSQAKELYQKYKNLFQKEIQEKIEDYMKIDAEVEEKRKCKHKKNVSIVYQTPIKRRYTPNPSTSVRTEEEVVGYRTMKECNDCGYTWTTEDIYH